MKALLLFMNLALLTTVLGEVGNNDLQDIRKLTSEGKYEEALQKHLWFHEVSKASPGMGGVRLSFALSQWAELGTKYPKALDALKGIRDQHEQLLLSGKGGFPEFHEYSAINRTLHEDDKTYNLFKQLHAKYPDIAAKCFDVTLDLLVEHKDYELCGTYIKDPIGLYENIRHMREMNLSLAKRNPKMQDANFKNYADKTFVDKTSQLIEILVHVNKLDGAKEIQKRAIGYFPNQKIKDTISVN